MKTLHVTLSVCLLLGLSACGDSESSTPADEGVNLETQGEDGLEPVEGTDTRTSSDIAEHGEGDAELDATKPSSLDDSTSTGPSPGVDEATDAGAEIEVEQGDDLGGPDSEEDVQAQPVEVILTLALTGEGSGRVTSEPPGIDCPGQCEATFLSGTALTLEAKPAGDSVAAGFTQPCAGASSCAFSLEGDLSLEASFNPALLSAWTLHGTSPEDTVWVGRATAYGDDGIAIAGGFDGGVDFGNGVVTSSGGGVDAFVARYSSDDELMWLWRFGDETVSHYTADDGVLELAGDSQGNLFVAGTFAASVDFGDGTVVVPEADETVVPQGAFIAKLARLDGDLEWAWTAPLGTVRSASVTPDDAVVFAGGFSGSATFGDEERVASGLRDIFMAKYSADGEFQWVKTFGDEAPLGIDFEGASTVRVAPNGDIVLSGFYDGSVDFGGESHTAVLDSFGVGLSSDIFIARYTSEGELLWSRTVGGPGIFNASKSLAIAPNGDIVAAGWWSHMVSFGDVSFANGLDPAEIDVWIARWSATGDLHWAKTMGSPGAIDRWDQVVIAPSGRSFVSGGFFGGQVLGEPLEATGGMDALLVELSEEGEFIWADILCNDEADDLAPAMALSGQGHLILAGWFQGEADLGLGTESAVGKTSSYVIRRQK
ncbi:MAG: hypothetical protein ACPGU1_17865 [Myxococcota bacterium]